MTDRKFRYVKLEVPPATGAVLWALELAIGQPVDADTRRKVIENVKARL
jgi:hypothetical protein